MRQPPFRPRSQFVEAVREYRAEHPLPRPAAPPLPPRWSNEALAEPPDAYNSPGRFRF